MSVANTITVTIPNGAHARTLYAGLLEELVRLEDRDAVATLTLADDRGVPTRTIVAHDMVARGVTVEELADTEHAWVMAEDYEREVLSVA